MRLSGKSCKRKIGETAGPETGLELGWGWGRGEDFGNMGGSDRWEQGLHSVAKGFVLGLGQCQVSAMLMFPSQW